ncbi:MAG: hypothetical protein OQL09_10340 [Gammaproteobacteria bacterium]|nr:hypothetical protein [Gammaproteobacteria bacterium]
MCFSATVSFASAAALVSIGAFCVTKSRMLPVPYRAIALVPFLFGVQQFLEGILWQYLDSTSIEEIRTTALGYMFFSHFFWLFWIPLISYLLEGHAGRKNVFFGMMLVGSLYGGSMYIPLWLNTDWLLVQQIKHSISYETVLIYDDYVPRVMVRALYALIVVLPLLLSSELRLRRFGYIVAVSVLMAAVFYGYAFISVWCFFAAILSIYMAYMVLSKSAEKKSRTRVE